MWRCIAALMGRSLPPVEISLVTGMFSRFDCFPVLWVTQAEPPVEPPHGLSRGVLLHAAWPTGSHRAVHRRLQDPHSDLYLHVSGREQRSNLGGVAFYIPGISIHGRRDQFLRQVSDVQGRLTEDFCREDLDDCALLPRIPWHSCFAAGLLQKSNPIPMMLDRHLRQ